MVWKIEFTKKAQKQINKLDNPIRSNIKRAILDRLVIDPKQYLIQLKGDKKEFYKFRISDYRLLCHLNEDRLYILVIKVKHRKDVYINS